MKFSIQPLPKNNSLRSKIPQELPQSNLLFIAPSNSGKTTIIVNMLLKKSMGYIFEYSEIHIVSPTLYLDNSWEMIQSYNSMDHPKKYASIMLHDEYNPETLKELIEYQKNLDNDKRKKILIVLDDVADLLQKNNKILTELFFKGRHYKISTWITSQSYKAIPRGIRINSPGFIFLNLNTNERNMVTSELSRENPKEFNKKLDDCIKEKYSFLYLNMRESIEKMYCKNFSSYL